MRKRRLFWQLYPSYLLITLVCLAAVTLDAVSSLRKFYLDRTAAELQSRALLAEEQFRPLLAAGRYPQIDALCKQLGEKADTRFTVILPNGKVVGDSQESPERMDNHADRPEVKDALAGGAGVSLRESKTIGETLRYVAIPLRSNGKIVGVVRTAISLTAIERALSGIRFHLLTGCLLAALVLAGVTLVLSRRIARPLEQLQQGTERFARGDLTHRLSVADSLELGSLAEMLNQMAANLDEKMRALAQQRSQWEAILSSMVEGVLAVDCQERVIHFNQAAARLVGIDQSRAQGRTLPEVVRNTELQRLVARVLASHEPAEGEVVLRGNEERFLYLHGTVLRGAREEQNGALVVMHDVTELKRLEKIRRDFVANVSHELRTPVTAIKGFIETLLDGAMHNPEELQRFLEIVAEQTDRLNAIFEDLLTLARIEQGAEKAEITLMPAPLRSVLEAALIAFAGKAAEKNLRLELNCEPDLVAAINPPLLEQALVNLIDNAVKYSPPEQTVRVEAVRAGDEVLIHVVDQGCGIDREHLPRIFERFYRVDKARSRKLGGTGLGLAIVKHVVSLHGGRVTVESAPGKGSTFTIHIK